MKKVLVLGMCLCIVFAFTSCKSSESSYRRAYEKAKQQEGSDPRLGGGSPVEISSSVPMDDMAPIDYSQSSDTDIEISAVELDPVEMPPADLTPIVSDATQQPYNSQQPSYGDLPAYNSSSSNVRQESVSYAGSYGTPSYGSSSYGSGTPSYSSSSRRCYSRGGGSYREYSVVCGSFGMKGNADRMRNFLSAEGYNATVVYAPEMAMYRVIIGTYSDRNSAVRARDAFRSKYSYRRELQNAWVLGSR